MNNPDSSVHRQGKSVSRGSAQGLEHPETIKEATWMGPTSPKHGSQPEKDFSQVLEIITHGIQELKESIGDLKVTHDEMSGDERDHTCPYRMGILILTGEIEQLEHHLERSLRNSLSFAS